ncbi:MAG: tetraprenyl-beta-curcumene synthase family protein [Syntrophomonadaceae bacterium]|nr:tetraprenyl-beta-curcumene synthase family protein [Syntrophomonadaceae bacterium]
MEIPNSTLADISSSCSRRSIKGQSSIMARYIFYILPLVKKHLGRWKQAARQCQSSELRLQALLSIKHKDFHCQGGAVFALAADSRREELTALIVAYQTICDYLDNLCDRAGCTEGRAFQQLHRALIVALSPGKAHEDYYQYYPYKNDGGYLQQLVEECQHWVQQMPSWSLVEKESLQLVNLYSNLQVYKHLMTDIREEQLKEWIMSEAKSYPDLYWQEFAAACGSTLALFALMALAASEDLSAEEVKSSLNAYFPWICSLHILLDYYIDRQEDLEGGDLNFTFYYTDREEILERLKLLVRQSHRCASKLSNSALAKTIVEGLLALYLSDPKVKQQAFQQSASELLAESGPPAFRTYQLCKVVRKFL